MSVIIIDKTDGADLPFHPEKAVLPIAESYHILKDLHRESLNKNSCNPMQIYGFSENSRMCSLCLIK